MAIHTKILLVESDADTQKQLVEFLSSNSSDFRILEATNAFEALNVVQKSNPKFVLMDIRLPGTNGLKLLQTIKNISPQTKVIINTHFDSMEYRLAASKNGADYFLSKRINNIKDILNLLKGT